MVVDFILAEEVAIIVGFDTEEIYKMMDNPIANTMNYLVFTHMPLENLVSKVDYDFEVAMVAKVRVYSNNFVDIVDIH